MTSTQWSALRYLRRASKFSRTLSAFADYHAITRASASQTIKGLEVKGLIARTVSENDRRSARLDLTKKGRDASETDPSEELTGAIKTLPQEQQDSLTIILENVLECFGDGGKKQTFGTCMKCRYLKEQFDHKTDRTTHFCTRGGEEIIESEIDGICMKYRSRN